MAKKLLEVELSEPLNGLKTTEVHIDPGDGNLSVDGSNVGPLQLASGTLQYLEKNGLPAWKVDKSCHPARFSIMASGRVQPWFRLPWSACNGATAWQVHLNPGLPVAVTAHSDGGNISLDLTGMPATRVSAETGGGNVNVALPAPQAELVVYARSGAGNVVISIPADTPVRVYASTGLGKVVLHPRLVEVAANTYQSPDYDHSDKKVQLTAESGAGNVVLEETTSQGWSVNN